MNNNELSNQQNEGNFSNLLNKLSSWIPLKRPCPKCGSTNTEYNYYGVLTSSPPQYNCKCLDCQHTFNSYEGDWSEYPITPYGGNLRTGWICPKCGRALSPDVNVCPYCDGYNNIVYCADNSVKELSKNTKIDNTLECANKEYFNSVLS